MGVMAPRLKLALWLVAFVVMLRLHRMGIVASVDVFVVALAIDQAVMHWVEKRQTAHAEAQNVVAGHRLSEAIKATIAEHLANQIIRETNRGVGH